MNAWLPESETPSALEASRAVFAGTAEEGCTSAIGSGKPILCATAKKINTRKSITDGGVWRLTWDMEKIRT